MEQFCEAIRQTGWKKPAIKKVVKDWAVKIKMADIKKHLEEVLGLQKFFNTKQQNLLRIAYLTLKGPTPTKAKNLVLESLLYEEEIDILRDYFTRTRQLKPYQKKAAKKMFEEVSRDSYKKDLVALLKECGIPCSSGSKKELLEYILLSFFEKPPKDFFCTEEKIVEEEECAICTEPLEKTCVRWRGCACRTHYHADCLEKWLSIRESCPTCRASL